jgi:NADPH-dependent curcumin reductase CurA
VLMSVVASGMISQYNNKPEEMYALRNIINIVPKRIKIQGFIVSDANMGPKYFAEHQQKLSQWIKDGSFKAKMSITKGLDEAPEGFIGMLAGKNFGKALLEISPLAGNVSV